MEQSQPTPTDPSSSAAAREPGEEQPRAGAREAGAGAREPGTGVREPRAGVRERPGVRERGGVREPRAGAHEPDPDGWGADYAAPPPPPRAGPDLSALFALLDAVRRAAPAEAQVRLTAFIREALLTLRSLIDWYLDRLDDKPREPRVQDIPID